LTGAAALAAMAALRGGAGLVTLLVPEELQAILAALVPPEVMVRPVQCYAEVAGLPFDVLAIGPGLGVTGNAEILDLIASDPRPMVLDADALNRIAARDVEAMLGSPPGPRLLTPHPGEMARLAGDRDEGQSARAWAEAFVAHHRVTLLLKGAHTHVCEAGRATAITATGNPGMATGGVGDTLTGLAAALIGQGLSPYDAGCVAAWVNGRAGEIALVEGSQSVESLRASDLAAFFGRAFVELREGGL